MWGTKTRFSIPERASGVKAPPADFVTYVLRQSQVRPVVSRLDWGSRNRLWKSVVAVMFCEVVRAVLVSCGGTPIHPFVNPPAESGSRSGRLGPDTEYSVTTVPRTPGRLNQTYARQGKPNPWHLSDWPCVHGGLSFGKKKGRCNRLSHYSRSSCCYEDGLSSLSQ